jgi:hypothetical protein
MSLRDTKLPRRHLVRPAAGFHPRSENEKWRWGKRGRHRHAGVPPIQYYVARTLMCAAVTGTLSLRHGLTGLHACSAGGRRQQAAAAAATVVQRDTGLGIAGMISFCAGFDREHRLLECRAA